MLAFKHGSRIALAPMMARLMAARLAGVDGGLAGGAGAAASLAAVAARLQPGGAAGARDRRLAARGWRSMRWCAARQHADARRVGRARPASALLPARLRSIAAKPGRLRGAKVVLVDDVLTSGATSEACVSALKRAGADKVMVCLLRAGAGRGLPS